MGADCDGVWREGAGGLDCVYGRYMPSICQNGWGACAAHGRAARACSTARKAMIIHSMVKNTSRCSKTGSVEQNKRLLYVAMTRARDRLYIGGFSGYNKRPDDCWYEMISQTLIADPKTQELEEMVKRYGVMVRQASLMRIVKTHLNMRKILRQRRHLRCQTGLIRLTRKAMILSI